MTKEETIKKAWGEHYGKIKSQLNDNGWYWFGYACNGWDDVIDMLNENNLPTDYDTYEHEYQELDNGEFVAVMFRPKSLQGIENNNGWIKIESEDDLPKDFITCYIMTIYSNNTIAEAYYTDGERRFKSRDVYSTWSYSFDEITHYQPIEKPKLPIY